MSKEKPQKLDRKSLKELSDWIDEQEKEGKIPDSILSILFLILSFFSVGDENKRKRDLIYELWKTLWGIDSKSESRSSTGSGNAGGTKKKESNEERKKRLEREKQQREREKKEVQESFHACVKNCHERLEEMKKHSKISEFNEHLWCIWKLHQLKDRRRMTATTMNTYFNNWNNAIDNVPPFKKSSQNFGSWKVEVPMEDLFGSLPYSILPRKKHRVPLTQNNPTPNSPIRTRVVRELSITYQEIEIEVEHRTDSEGSKTYAKDPLPIAPPRIQYTFSSIINIMMLVVSFGIPIARLSTMLKGFPSGFSSSTIWELLQYAAERLCPIYIQLAKELNKCKHLHGDDTVPRVLELREEDDDISEPRSVRKKVEKYFPIISRTKDGSFKEKILTSFVSGVTEENREASRILFYRTHRGSVGNLLNSIFELRSSPKNEKESESSKPPPKYCTQITLTSDLSKENLPSEKILKKHGIEFEVTGCLAHARRGIFRNKNADPKHCETILQYFEDIYSVEKYIKEKFNNQLDAKAELRRLLSSRFWAMIVREAKQISNKWPESDIKRAADYIIRNDELISKFLMDPKLEPDNNFSERNVRPEKMFKNNRLFSRTVLGRVMLDILLTVIRTAVASGTPLEEYLMWVFQSDPQKIEEDPGRFIPFAYVKEKEMSLKK